MRAVLQIGRCVLKESEAESSWVKLGLCLPQTHSELLPQQVEAFSVAIIAVCVCVIVEWERAFRGSTGCGW